jgi:hypothetical protein
MMEKRKRLCDGRRCGVVVVRLDPVGAKMAMADGDWTEGKKKNGRCAALSQPVAYLFCTIVAQICCVPSREDVVRRIPSGGFRTAHPFLQGLPSHVLKMTGGGACESCQASAKERDDLKRHLRKIGGANQLGANVP